MSFGKKVRKLRLAKSMSQTKLGELTNIPQTTISDWENSKSLPNIEDAKKIAKVLNVEIAELLTQKGA
ncbi:MAG: helix-turn-helix domain-containing protein [Alkaliphilus sp.]